MHVRGLLAWLAKRAYVVLTNLTMREAPPVQQLQQKDPWQTGSFYAAPQIRNRPRYPGLKEERARVDGSDLGTDGCPKHYSSYKEEGLTPGIFAIWCRHSICVGFHLMPEAEGASHKPDSDSERVKFVANRYRVRLSGRNDLFSAIFTRWKKAPDIIVYDFACAAASYCLQREAAFFSQTRFYIDEFHAKGHATCSAALRLGTAMSTSADLSLLNSSAAECGNAALRRVRLSLSFMREDHAIILSRMFIEVWNRRQKIAHV